MTINVGAAIEAMKAAMDPAAASYLDACVHCGLCAEACHFYVNTGDVRYVPTYKMELMRRVYKRYIDPLAVLKKPFGLVPPELTEQDLIEWSDLVYDSCTVCGRCSIACPMGIDVAGVVRKTRLGMVAAGLVPPSMRATAERALATGSALGIGPAALRKVIEAQAQAVGIPIELDKKGAEYMVIASAIEVLQFYEVIGALARIFKQAGIDWTISTKAYEATNIGVQMGDRATAKTLVGRVVDAAEELGVKYVVSPECGHAYGALNWEGPNLIGRRYNFQVIHILELLDRLCAEGRIRTKGKDTRRVTYHDPCQIGRRGGIVDEPRNVLSKVAANFVEMAPNRGANICCGGGGGVSSNNRADDLRIKAFGSKKRQVQAACAEALVTSCANCRNVLEEAIDAHGMTLPVISLTELLARYLDDA